ncbi:MAG: HAD-IG family 5'-nucleotidase [Polyangiales bacterium]|nr:HAD-IG family 5'-nucleotidase [Myxococcales bacterium]
MSSQRPDRGIFCNRTVNIRSIRAIGFDMDYTLIHYRTEEWERRAYEHVKQRLLERGWPVEALEFDPELVTRGLILDIDLGNMVKANRFGFVKRACHGTRMLDYDEQRTLYAREQVDLSGTRWVFLNTYFNLSEACMYMQTVDLLDAGKITPKMGDGAMGYEDLYKIIRSCIDETHMEGSLKAEILADPNRYVDLDEDLPLALLDLKHAGRTLLLITNSEWHYTKPLMSYAFDRFLPGDMTWRELFDVKIVGAGKPSFFSARNAVFEVVDEEGLLRPARALTKEGCFLGGNARMVEELLGVPGDDILYVGDHMFSDVHVSKSILRWRTALVVRELEPELVALEAFKPKQLALSEMMRKKDELEDRYSHRRLALQRLEHGYGPQPTESAGKLRQEMQGLRAELVALDGDIAPLAKEAGELVNTRWGLLMRAGNDKSHMARQIERYADMYMSRVSNLLWSTPFVYLRSPRGSLPHDGGPDGGT